MAQTKKRIVQINAVYGKGSTGCIVSDIHNFLKKNDFESYVFTASDSMTDKHDEKIERIGNNLDHFSHAVLWRFFQNQGWNSQISTIMLCKRLKELKPDIVHLHNLHSNYLHLGILLRFLANEKITVVLTMHDCWFFTGNCFHFLKYDNCQNWLSSCSNCPKFGSKIYKYISKELFENKKELFGRLNQLAVIGVSDWITGCSKMSVILGGAHYFRTIHNWIDCDIFKPLSSVELVKEKYGIDGRKIILGVSQGWSNDKGLLEFRSISQKLSKEAVVILVGDPCGQSSTEDMKFIGYTSSVSELANLYSAADVFVNPSRMETFGKVTAEALASGTPVVCYGNTGTMELVNNSVGECVPDGSQEMLLAATEKILKAGKDAYGKACRERALTMFDKETQLSKYTEFYEQIFLDGVEE